MGTPMIIHGGEIFLLDELTSSRSQVLVDSATYEATSTAVEYVKLPPMEVKGKKNKLDVYRPTGEVYI
jgi:hypothetical protein